MSPEAGRSPLGVEGLAPEVDGLPPCADQMPFGVNRMCPRGRKLAPGVAQMPPPLAQIALAREQMTRGLARTAPGFVERHRRDHKQPRAVEKSTIFIKNDRGGPANVPPPRHNSRMTPLFPLPLRAAAPSANPFVPATGTRLPNPAKRKQLPWNPPKKTNKLAMYRATAARLATTTALSGCTRLQPRSAAFLAKLDDIAALEA